jgi:hypothetical protein
MTSQNGINSLAVTETALSGFVFCGRNSAVAVVLSQRASVMTLRLGKGPDREVIP